MGRRCGIAWPNCSGRSDFGPTHMERYPHEFSGGQRQRLGIARALQSRTQDDRLLTSRSRRSTSRSRRIINLLVDLQDETGPCLPVHLARYGRGRTHQPRVAVIYLGRIVETRRRRRTFCQSPLHPYTEALLAAVPFPTPVQRGRIVLSGDLPSPINPPPGCRFHPRCPYVFDRCRIEAPPLVEVMPITWCRVICGNRQLTTDRSPELE